ncbi:beta-ketoacyl synthase N-terminal-like domain-containing protein [Streptomyces sp. NBC_01102]|uniref:beta-ketoacyl synthase N-terminal-like domain-containing protein n=1 Tax=Streptomyces sp. NBC_01102 TaxID=2903749 RepID=UPI00386B6D0F
MGFEPIAVVGRGCVLPDALDPDTFWDNIAAGRRSLSAVPDDRWRLPRQWAMGSVDDHLDRTWTDVGGYVRGFDSTFDPGGFLIGPEQILGLDPLFRWVLHGARQALTEAGREGPLPRAGLVLGNLSYPTETGSAYAEHVWLSAQRPSVRDALLTDGRRARPDARNRFSSGLPAQLAARALGLGAGGWALDAACASSLYAIKLACDRLHDGTADLMVAGAVNRVDNLYLHVGFCGLGAVSRTGRSRPFHQDADGLMHGEGAGFVALTRLSDALASGLPVLGVIRGVGLSNDGRGHGLLSPAEEGQVRAIRLAYASAGIAPETVSLVECHATGTPVGDAVEARGMARIYAGGEDVPIGSAKSNVGHLLASAGVAGLLKLLGAMRTGIRPATLGAERPLAELRGTPLRVLTEPEPWPGRRRAALSAFGFGGTNAHLIVDCWDRDQAFAVPAPSRPRADARIPDLPAPTPPPAPEPSGRPVPDVPGRRTPVAIVALGARGGDGADTEDFRRAVLGGERRGPVTGIAVELADLCFPPLSLEHTVPHQLLVLEAAREAVRGVSLPRERTMVVIGTGVDPEVARAGARWRVPYWLQRAGEADDADSLDRARDAFVSPMTAERVVGSLPNLVASRISTQLDLAGPGFAVSAEEASGPVALGLAARAIRAGEVDAALVGATDLSCGLVARTALRELGHASEPGDAAVVLVLKPLDAARRDGDTVVALLDEDPTGVPDLVVGDGPDAVFDPASLFGRAHAAQGLLSVAVAAVALRHRVVPCADRPADPGAFPRTAAAVVSPLEGAPATVRLRAGDPLPWLRGQAPRLHVFSGGDRREVLAALASGRESSDGPARLALVVEGEGGLAVRAEAARRWLTEGGIRPADVFYRDGPVTGCTAFVYTNGSASYRGMGHELMLALPSLGEAVRADHGPVAAWARPCSAPTVLDQIWGAAGLAAVHTELTRNMLGLRPDAAIGYSSGESAALVALRAWPDAAGLYGAARDSGLFTTELTGELRTVRRAWERLGVRGSRWSSYLVNAPLDRVRTELSVEVAVHLMAVNAPGLCVIGGESRACAAVVARLGDVQAIAIDYDMAAHVPELADVRDRWREVHHRPTVDVPGVRFYSGATGRSYRPTPERAAEALTAQGLGTIDFAATVEQAWADGVRVFVEHGPSGLCTGWVKRVLGDRDHVAVALDAPQGTALRQLCLAVAELVVAGVPVRAEELFRSLGAAAVDRTGRGPTVTVSVPATPRLPSLQAPAVIMRRAPELTPLQEWEAGLCAAPAAAEVVEPRAERQPEPTDVRALVVRQTRRVTALHQEITALHTETHLRFLHTSAQAVAALTRTGAGGGTRTGGVGGTPPLPVRLPGAATPPPHAEPGAAPSPSGPRQGPLPGPKFDRAQLEHLASGRISALFGPRFAAQDAYAVQTRMPEPPMLLADRVAGIDAEPAALAGPGQVRTSGTIWTETDVRLDSWYLDPAGRMPAGLMIEAGQADLLLISWLGVDLLNRGERAYRLLGCELTYHGSPPEAGDTLCYEIHIDGHAEHDGVRLFFFHYDCSVNGELRLSVRNGQAGFFTRAELADSAGVRWDPADCPPGEGFPLDPPAVRCELTGFTAERVRALSEGRPADCFGPGWEATAAHVRSPGIDTGRLRLLHEVTEFDPAGGPWGRGYLRAETPVSPDDWFFAGHFRNDPCMPGTLMLQGGFQAMAFYLAAMGFTVGRDGWRFEPVDGSSCSAGCRGQATPESRRVVYEVFVRGVSSGPLPTLYADVLGTVDGVKAFHGRDVALRLVPDWPLSHWRRLGPPAVQDSGVPVPLAALGGLDGHTEDRPVASVGGFPFGYASLLACAWGRPSEAFGAAYTPFDGTRKVARLPGPPYHFMSRIAEVDGPQGGMREGSAVVAEYDVPDAAWYFEQNDGRTMPFAVLLEIALQPCGWLASYVGSALTTGTDLLFRNLDGSGTVTGEVTPATGSVRTDARLTRVSRSGDMIIESFDVTCTADGEPLFELSTVFGYFPPSAFDHQAGLPVSAEDRARLDEPCDRIVDLTSRPDRYCAGPARLPGPMLLMLDRITGYWPDGGCAGLGRLRSEKDVDAGEWFFAAHFFQDPVQPGSLGIEAMCQLLRYHLIERGMTAGVPDPRFEPVLPGREMTWTYRGQITPANRLIRVEMEVLEAGHDARGPYATAEASLWGDDTCIYRVRGLGMRVVPGGGPVTAPGDPSGQGDGPTDGPGVPSGPATSDPTGPGTEELLDPGVDTWVADHCPTWTVPVLPMMSVLDRLAGAAADRTGRRVVAVRDVRLRRWIPVSGPVRLRTEAVPGPGGAGDGLGGVEVRLLVWREAGTAALSRFEEAATATVWVGDRAAAGRPDPFAPLPDAEVRPDPYASAELFHGPAFRYLTSWSTGATGSSGVLDAGRGTVPPGHLNQGLLDAVVQVIPHQGLRRWAPDIGGDEVGFPHRVVSLDVYEVLPRAGLASVEARFAGFDCGDRSLPVSDVQLLVEGRVVAALRLVSVLLPVTALASGSSAERREFAGRRPVAGLGLSRQRDGVTVLTAEDVEGLDWLRGTVAQVWGLPSGARGRDHLELIAVKEHVGRPAGVHPSAVEVAADLRSARVAGAAGPAHRVEVTRVRDTVTVRSAAAP